MRIRTSIAFVAFLLLASCMPLSKPGVPTEKRTESGALPSIASDAPLERLLPTGILEIGDRDAPLTLLLFTEYHCHYCREFAGDHLPKLLRDFVATKKLRLQIAILPLKKYSLSEPTAIAALCAAAQGKGLAMHAKLLGNLEKDTDAIASYAEELKLEMKLFKECVASDDAKGKIEMQKSLARSLDVTLVPTLFLNGEKSVGLPYWPDLRGMIEEKT